MLLKIYLMDAHEVEGGTLANSNLSGDFPAYPVVCEIIDAVITILGPDIQESPRTRALVLNLVHEFSLEEDESICVEAIKCIQHFLMFAPEHVQIPELVDNFEVTYRLLEDLSSSHPSMPFINLFKRTLSRCRS